MKVRVTTDREAAASYVYLPNAGKVARTVEAPNGALLDYDAEGNLVGVEFLELVEVETVGAGA